MSIFEDRPFIPKAEKPILKDKPKVSRYRAGKAPEWADRDESDEEEINLEAAAAGPIKVERKSDRRLERLQEGAVNKEEALRRRRNRDVVAEVVSVAKKEEDEDEEVEEEEDRRRRRPTSDAVAEIVSIKTELPDEEDDDADARRERARQQYLKKKQEEEAEKEVLPVEEEQEEEEEEEESEYETDSDFEEWPNRPTIKPVFVSKQDRETIAERDKRLEEEERQEEERLMQLEERKKESLVMLKAEIARAAQEEKDAMEGGDRDERVMSDEEDEDEAKEYELWKEREIARIKRDRAEREAMEAERLETERRRNMSDLEIRELDKDKFVKEKKQLKFLQKYYHKGAFFREGNGEDIQNRDFSGATGEDLINKESLPKIMQVKNFGRSGRTKYTHLADQDTSVRDNPWAIKDSFSTQNTQKLGGMHGGFERPALKKRKQDL